MFEELKVEEIEVGKQYHYEEKYYCCANVTVLEVEHGENKEKLRSPNWVGWKIRVDKSFGGMTPLEEGKVLSIGYDSKYSHYTDIKFKKLGSMPDYTGFEAEKAYKF